MLALDEFPDVMEDDKLEENEKAEERVAHEWLKICEDERKFVWLFHLVKIEKSKKMVNYN